ncbi:MAG: RHS repeat-associated core domain-containing protein [bacterium]
MRKILSCLVVVLLPLLFSTVITQASDQRPEKDIQGYLGQSKAILEQMGKRLQSGSPISDQLASLRTLAEGIKASHLLMMEQFRLREERVGGHGAKALERHRAMSESYRKAVEEYLSLLEDLLRQKSINLTTLDRLKAMLDQILHVKKRPILGSLPYKNLNYPSKEPSSEPPIKPAYKGGNKTLTAEDLKSIAEAPITEGIANLSQSLNWNPVSIYEWVKNNIETEWYWGSMKGAEETLSQKSGNDCDQASLLIALLRASGFPARYVRGVIEFFPDVEKAKNLTGITDPTKIAEYFQKAGIPFQPVVAGGRISNFQIEHIWVETEIPYANYRGAPLDQQGKTWLGLDTSVKPTGYTYNTPIELPQDLSLLNARDGYLSGVQTQTPLEYLKAYINSQLAARNPPLLNRDSQPATYNDLLRTKTLIPEVMNILPASMQYQQVKITREYTEVPDELKHKVRFTARDPKLPTDSPELFSVEYDISYLSNQKVALSYEPENIEDQEIINSYGGLDNTPAYLVRLRPVLGINGERMVVGRDGLPMGADYTLTLEIISPNGTEKITNTHIIGNLSVVGIVSQKAINIASGFTPDEKDAEEILFEEAINYIDRWNKAEEELASLLQFSVTRPIPTVITLGGVIDVTYLLDTPHEFNWKGVFVDANLRVIESVWSVASGFTPDDKQKVFMTLSALQGSILEDRIFEDDFQVEGISTAKLFGLAHSMQPATEILTIDKSNIDEILPTLSFDQNIKEDIQNSVNQNLAIRIPCLPQAGATAIQYEDWTGIGYLKENPSTGESGYMLSGMIAGGMTAWGIDKWPAYYADTLSNSNSEPPNQDPTSATSIQKITKTDLQKGKVGQPLDLPLQIIVSDKKNKPVSQAEVTFTIKAGGGKFSDGSTTSKAKTGGDGIASVRLILGQKTSDNPTFVREQDINKPNVQQVGENIVDASLPPGTKITKPFTAYGFPGDATQIKQTGGDGWRGPILSFAGFVSAMVLDQYENPISNLPVTFGVLPATDKSTCSNPNQDVRQAVLVKREDPCLKSSPTLGQCASAASSLVEETDSKGALVQVILGSIPQAEYPITAGSGGFNTIFRLYTNPFGNCSGNDSPSIQFSLETVYLSDSYGNNITAGKIGTKIPVQAKIHFLKEGETENEITINCNEGPLTCKQIVGNRQYSRVTYFLSSSVTFAGQAGMAQGNGIYSSAYTLQPGFNRINVEGKATTDYRWTERICPGTCNRRSSVVERSDVTAIGVYGVDIQVDPTPIVIVDEQGYAANDYTINYTITPPEYKALLAFLFIYKDGELIATLPTEASGEGIGTISRGFQFDLNSKYQAEVVLNPGTGVEIRSDRVPITLVQENIANRPFTVERTDIISQFDSGVPSSPFYDEYRTYKFNVTTSAKASLKIFERDSSLEKATVIPETSLALGEYRFVVDYTTILNAGFSPILDPSFDMVLEIKPDDGSNPQIIYYPGKMSEVTRGKMLGQVVVHDVLIQDGSLNLSRQDVALKGRGPQLAFTRSYNNQSSGKGFKPLGEGWSHSLDMRLYPLSSNQSGSDPVPAWVTKLKGRFYTTSDVPNTLEGWTLVSVNGTTFKKIDNTWYAERGRHGTLREEGGDFIYTSKDGTEYRYDYPASLKSETHVKTIQDRNGNVTTFNYDSTDRLLSVVDSVACKFEFTYEDVPAGMSTDNSRLMKLTGPDGIELLFTYNKQGYLESVTREARVETYQYAAEPGIALGDYNLVKTTDTNSHSYLYEYYGPNEVDPNLSHFVKALKSQDVVKEVQYPDGNTAQFQYNVQTANKRIVTDLRGNDTSYTLNYFGNPTRIEEPGGRVTSMTWSIDEGKSDNVMTSKTDPRGNTTSYKYDSTGNITRETDPFGKSTATAWNQKFSVPESRIDRNNITETWHYDDKGNLEWYENGDAKRTNYTYYTTGERQSMTDPRGKQTTYTYDQWGNPDTVTEPEGSVTDFDYDIRGRRIAVTDPKGNKTEYTYDALDYPRKIIYPEISPYNLPSGSTNIHEFEYDPVGNLLSETNRVGLKLDYIYTPGNQVQRITRTIGGTKTFDYDPNGNLLSETDWKGVATTHAYNTLNQRISTTNRLGNTMSMSYDLNGNLSKVTDYESRVTDYEYDKLNRLTDTWQPALEGQSRGNIHNSYYDEADPKTNLKTETDQEGHTTAYEYNGRHLRTKRTNALNDVYTWEYDDSGNLIKETDEEGKYTQYGYDGQNRRTSLTRMGNIVTTYRFDANGNQTHLIDALNRDTETRYDEWNRAYQVIDADSYITTTEFDGEGKSVKVTDGNNHVRSSTRDQRGLILAATDGEGNTARYTYDQNSNLETITDAKGFITRNAYDAEDRPTTTTEVLGTDDERTKAVPSRDKMGNPLQLKDFNGNITTTEYNALYLPSRVFDPAPFDSQFTETTYYKTGKVNTVKNRRGYATTHEYDALNREIKVTDAKRQTVETTYDKAGHVKTVKDKRGIVTENFYDDLYRLIRVEKAGIRLKTNEYDDVGNLTGVIDANGNRTGHTYNKRNLLETTTYPDTFTEKRTYDGVGNLLALTNEENKITTYTYDKENRQTSVEFEGEKTVKAYDAIGNLISIIRPKGNVRAMTYNGLKQLITVIDAPGDQTSLNLTTRYGYDANGNQTHQYDAKGNHVEFTYDSLNRKTQHIQHKASGDLTSKFTYDEEGNLKSTTDPKNQQIAYTYDELNRQSNAYHPNVASPFNQITRIYTEYDSNNSVTMIIETKTGPDGSTITDTTVNHYDNFDRLDGSNQRGLTIDYAYDNNGNRTQVSTPAGSTIYAYNSRNWLFTARDNESRTTSYTYYPDGKKDTITYPNNTSAKYTYKPTNRIETITHKSGASTISSFAYDYDKNGNRISQTEVQSGVTETTACNYDATDRLKDYTITSGSNTTLTEYTFDGYNHKTEKVTNVTLNSVLSTKNYFYDETNWLTRIDDTIAGNSITYAYDENGNTINKIESALPGQDTDFVYDSRNQLVQVTRGSTVLGQYDYNSKGLRVRHRLSERGDVDYYYDDNAVIEEHNASDNSLIAHYRYADRLLSLNSALGTQYYHHDGLGSTVNLTTDTGAVQVSYLLDPWGHIRGQAGDSINRHIFTDHEYDGNTGLIYFGARYYDPDTARFITQDAYLGENDTPPSLNRYLYAYSNPTVFIDLQGYVTEEAIENVKQEEGAYWAPEFARIIQKYSGLNIPAEQFAMWTTTELMTASLGVTIIETANGMYEFGRRIFRQNGEVSKFFKQHEEYADMIDVQISHGHKVDPKYFSDPKFREAFVDYAKVNPNAINVQFDIPAKGLIDVLGTKEGQSAIKNWFKQEFDFTDESVNFAERSKRAWNLSLALYTVGQVAKPMEEGLRNFGKAGSLSGGGESSIMRFKPNIMKSVEAIANPLPENSTFVRVMPKKYAEAFLNGKGNLGSGTEEVFISAVDDLAKATTRAGAQQRLSLFRDVEGTLPNTSGDVMVKFKLRDVEKVGVRSPIETVPSRGYGFKPGGRTAGGAREWIINNGTAHELGAYEIEIIPLR